MINWAETKTQLNKTDLSGHRPRVIVTCDSCGAQGSKTIRKKSDVIDNQLPWECTKCIANRPEKKAKSKAGALKGWEDPEYREKLVSHLDGLRNDPEIKAKMAAVSKRPEIKEMLLKHNQRSYDQTTKLKMAKNLKKRWEDPDYRKKQIKINTENSIRNWQDPEYQKKMAKIRAEQPKVSSIQTALYEILEELDVPYYREYNDKTDDPQCTVGPYGFDCVVPRNDKSDLLIECQGDYWHSIKEVITRDQAKSTYISKHFSDKYEIKYLWEHEFADRDRIAEVLQYWLGAKTDVVNFNFSDVEVRPVQHSDYKEFLSKYHYLANAGRGGIAHGAYLKDELIAISVFSPLLRQNIQIADYSREKTRELSRLCIHPKYQKKNFGSWLISKSLKLLDKKYNCIISYCDTTFNHDGAMYKASNFKLDKTIKPDYWYVDENGWVMHKRTLYSHAIKDGMVEQRYADCHGYLKVWGKEKLRFIYER